MPKEKEREFGNTNWSLFLGSSNTKLLFPFVICHPAVLLFLFSFDVWLLIRDMKKNATHNEAHLYYKHAAAVPNLGVVEGVDNQKASKFLIHLKFIL